MKLGILKETKTPPDRRVPFSPAQLSVLQDRFPELEIVVQEGGDRCFTDDEYKDVGINVISDPASAEILMGVKEVEIDSETGKPVKYYKFSSPHRSLLQMTPKRSVKTKGDGDGDYSLVDGEYCDFSELTAGPPGFFKTRDEETAERLRQVLKAKEDLKLPAAFVEVTEDPAFANF